MQYGKFIKVAVYLAYSLPAFFLSFDVGLFFLLPDLLESRAGHSVLQAALINRYYMGLFFTYLTVFAGSHLLRDYLEIEDDTWMAVKIVNFMLFLFHSAGVLVLALVDGTSLFRFDGPVSQSNGVLAGASVINAYLILSNWFLFSRRSNIEVKSEFFFREGPIEVAR